MKSAAPAPDATVRWTVAIVVVVVAVGVTSGPALADTLIVDAPNPALECPAADFPSINEAVGAADPGDTINVCPGLYAESVLVPKTVALLGSGPEPRERTGDPLTEAVVSYPGPGFVGLEVAADGVSISGFTIQGSGLGTGARTSPAFSGYLVERNLFHRNSTDLVLRSNGADEAVVRHNAFNNEHDAAAIASRFAITNLGGATTTLTNARVHHNFLTKHAMPFGPAVLLLGVSQVTLDHNELVDDNEILVQQSAAVRISHNRSLRSSASGIRAFDTAGLQIEHNDVEAAAQAGIVVGDEVVTDEAVVAHNYVTASTSGGITVVRSGGVLIEHNAMSANQIAAMRVSFGGGNFVRHNHITSNAAGLNILLEAGTVVENNIVRENERNGILVAASTGTLVERNVAARNGIDGILLRSSSGTLVRANNSRSNGKDGIEAEATSVGNTLVANDMLHNAEHDCHDDSVGPGTGGTGNIWLDNRGPTENRPGLCEPN